MEIIIGDDYESTRYKIGISVKEIKNTIQFPDSSYIMDLNQLEKNLLGKSVGKNIYAGFYLKHYIKEDVSYYILVCTREPEEQTLYVYSAYYINEELISKISTNTPYETLLEFVNIFGLNIIVKGRMTKFIESDYLHSDEIPSDFIKISFPKEHHFISSQFIKKSREYFF